MHLENRAPCLSAHVTDCPAVVRACSLAPHAKHVGHFSIDKDLFVPAGHLPAESVVVDDISSDMCAFEEVFHDRNVTLMALGAQLHGVV